MKLKDQRIKLMNEVLNGIKVCIAVFWMFFFSQYFSLSFQLLKMLHIIIVVWQKWAA